MGYNSRTESFMPDTTTTSPNPARFRWRREQKVTNINSGMAGLGEITSQNYWHVASMKTFIWFVQSVSHVQDRAEGGEEWESERMGESASRSQALSKRQRVQKAERQGSHHIWKFQTCDRGRWRETRLGVPPTCGSKTHSTSWTASDRDRFRFYHWGRAFFVKFLFREGGNIKMRYGRISLHLTKSWATINMHWMLSHTVLSARNIVSVFIKVKRNLE